MRRTCVRPVGSKCSAVARCSALQGCQQCFFLTPLQISTAFRQVDEDGQPIKRSPEEVADILQLPLLRCILNAHVLCGLSLLAHHICNCFPVTHLLSLLCKQLPNLAAPSSAGSGMLSKWHREQFLLWQTMTLSRSSMKMMTSLLSTSPLAPSQHLSTDSQ